MNSMESVVEFYTWMMSNADPRVASWPLMETPLPICIIFVLYLLLVFLGPRVMADLKPYNLKYAIIVYNAVLVYWSMYMCYEFFVTSWLSNYSYVCQPVDYSSDPLALRMASVCWWFFFSKVVELLDTSFFILRKKNNQISFLHVYHHCTMLINWYLGARFVAGGQSFFLAMLNSFVHIWMYTYYALSALGPHMQKYLWWKKYMTVLQLTQFILVIAHTAVNMSLGSSCSFPAGFNYAVFLYSISLVILFSNFFRKTYSAKKSHKIGVKAVENGSRKADKATGNGQSNGASYSNGASISNGATVGYDLRSRDKGARK